MQLPTEIFSSYLDKHKEMQGLKSTMVFASYGRRYPNLEFTYQSIINSAVVCLEIDKHKVKSIHFWLFFSGGIVLRLLDVVLCCVVNPSVQFHFSYLPKVTFMPISWHWCIFRYSYRPLHLLIMLTFVWKQ